MNINSRTSKINFTGFASGAIASFTGLRSAPLKIRADINPIQSGSGDPSPDNIRPIIGASECNVVRCGKNLFDGIFPEIGALVKYRQFKVNNGTYTFSTTCPLNSENAANIFAFGGYVTSGGSTAVNGLYQNMTRTVTTTDGYITLAYRKTSVNPEDYNTQIELGSTSTAYEAYTDNTYTIALGDTYYGGSLDVTTGELTVDKGIVDMGSLNWVYDSTYNRFNTTYSQIKASPAARTAKIMCSVLNPITDGRPVSQVPDNSIYQGTSYSISAHDHRFTDATLFTNAVTGQTIVFLLATPFTVQLTPTQVEQLLGANNIFSDTGNVEVYYVTI